MPGLNLGTFGGVAARPQATTAPNQATSVTAAAFGPGYTVSGPSTSSALAPNDAFGISFWLGIGAIAALAYIRHTLPR
jgi:hypothetical protein